jgi:hypothetical protein
LLNAWLSFGFLSVLRLLLRPFYTLLLGRPATMADLEAADPEAHRNLM